MGTVVQCSNNSSYGARGGRLRRTWKFCARLRNLAATYVEHAHSTHDEESCEVTPNRWTLPERNRQLRAWENTYNSIRPNRRSVCYCARVSSTPAIIPMKGLEVSLIMCTS